MEDPKTPPANPPINRSPRAPPPEPVEYILDEEQPDAQAPDMLRHVPEVHLGYQHVKQKGRR